MTKARRRIWAGASRDLAAANHGRMSRRHAIPTSTDPAARLAAVKANTATRRKDRHMTSISKNELVAALSRLPEREREQVLTEVGDSADRQTRMEEAAQALSDHARK